MVITTLCTLIPIGWVKSNAQCHTFCIGHQKVYKGEKRIIWAQNLIYNLKGGGGACLSWLYESKMRPYTQIIFWTFGTQFRFPRQGFFFLAKQKFVLDGHPSVHKHFPILDKMLMKRRLFHEKQHPLFYNRQYFPNLVSQKNSSRLWNLVVHSKCVWLHRHPV